MIRIFIFFLLLIMTACQNPTERPAVFTLIDPSKDTTFRAGNHNSNAVLMQVIVTGNLDGDFLLSGRSFSKGKINDTILRDWYDPDSIIVSYLSKGARNGNLIITATVNPDQENVRK